MLRKSLIPLAALAIVFAIAWPKLKPALAARAPGAGAPHGKPAAGSASSAPLRVTAVVIRPAPLAEVIGATGTLRAEEGVELQAEIAGKVVAINFDEGARVRKNDLLAKLNDADLRATLQRAVWRRDLAGLREKRMRVLLESHSVREEEYDAALNDLNVQRAEVAIAEAQIAKTEIRAPFDGVVGLRFVSEGAYISATARVAALQSLDNVKVDFGVPEKYARRIKLGTPITFTVPGADRKYQGKIYAVDPRIDTATRMVILRAIGPNADGKLLPGGFANVEFTLAEIPDALLVPSIAVIPGVSEKNVFVVVGGKAERRPVRTGTRNETNVHITEGLKPGDLVITSGLQQMRTGLPVAIADAAAPATKPEQRLGPAAMGKSSE